MARLFDSKQVMVHWDVAAEAVMMQWKRPAQYADFRTGLDAGLAEVAERSARRVLADHSMLNLQDEDEDHFLKQWVPKAAKAGVERLAIVLTRREFTQIPKTRICQRLKSGALELHYFDEMDLARRWVQGSKAA